MTASRFTRALIAWLALLRGGHVRWPRKSRCRRHDVFRYTARADAEQRVRRLRRARGVLPLSRPFRLRQRHERRRRLARRASRAARPTATSSSASKRSYRREFSIADSISAQRGRAGRRPAARAAGLRADVLLSAARVDGERNAAAAPRSSASTAPSTRRRPATCCRSTKRSR